MEWDKAEWANTKSALYLKVPHGIVGGPTAGSPERAQSDEERFLKWQRDWDNTKHQWENQRGTEFMSNWKVLTPREKTVVPKSAALSPALGGGRRLVLQQAAPPQQHPAPATAHALSAASNLQLQLEAVQARANALDLALQNTPRQQISSSPARNSSAYPTDHYQYSPRVVVPAPAPSASPVVPQLALSLQLKPAADAVVVKEEGPKEDSPRTVARQMMQAWDEKWSVQKSEMRAVPPALLPPDCSLSELLPG